MYRFTGTPWHPFISSDSPWLFSAGKVLCLKGAWGRCQVKSPLDSAGLIQTQLQMEQVFAVLV